MRAKIILQLSEGMTPTEVATAQRTSAKTVHRWRNRFEEEGVEGLQERARSGRLLAALGTLGLAGLCTRLHQR